MFQKQVLEDITILSSSASSMSLPVERMSQLSLESMSTSRGSQNRRREEDSAETAYESDIDTSISFDETAGIATFPSGMKYSVHGLDPGTRDAVAKALNTSSQLTLRGCSPRGQGYVFLISEPQSIMSAQPLLEEAVRTTVLAAHADKMRGPLASSILVVTRSGFVIRY